MFLAGLPFLRRRLCSVIVPVVALLSFAASSSAQAPGATLSGVVSDDSGAAVAGVRLTLADFSSGVQRTATSDGQGVYVFVGVPAGTYVLTVGSEPFAPIRLESLRLSEGEQRTLPLTLKIASLAERISVTGRDRNSTGRASFGKTEQSLREIPQSITVITRERLDAQNLSTLDQALAQTTGITVNNGGGTPNVALYSRGFALDTYQRDGVPVSTSGSFAQPNLALYERVEVLRGSNGLFNGAGNPGATVNLVRKRALAERRLQATVSSGSWQNYNAEVDLTGGLTGSGRLRGRVVAAYRDRNYFFNAADRDRNGLLYGRIEYDVAPRTTLSVGGMYEDRETPYFNGIPFYSTGASVGLPRSTYLAAAWSQWNFDKPEVFTEVDHSFNNSWKVRAAWNWVKEASDYKSATVSGPVDPVTLTVPALALSSGIHQQYPSTKNAIDVSVTGGFSMLGHPQQVIVGANYLGSREDGFSVRAPLPQPYPVDVFRFDPHAIQEPDFPAWESQSRTMTNQSGYYGVVRLMPINRLSIIAGARSSYWRRTGLNLLTQVTTSNYSVDGRVTPYGGLVYDVARRWSLYASYADVFQPQNAYTSRGELLPPVVGANYESGVKSDWLDGALTTSLAVFRIEQTNRSQTDPSNPPPCVGSPTGTCSIAEGKVRSAGFEAEANGRLSSAFTIFTGYTYNTTKYLTDRTTTGEPSANEGQPFQSVVPRHIVRVWANYQLPFLNRQVGVGSGLTAQSSWYVGSGTTRLEQGAYALWSAHASYVVNPHLTVSFVGNNLLDKTYWARLGNPTYSSYHGEPRNVTLTFRVR